MIDVMFAAPPGLQVTVTPVGGGQPLPIEMGVGDQYLDEEGTEPGCDRQRRDRGAGDVHGDGRP